jgi:probable HAF family extracellular repeat protein
MRLGIGLLVTIGLILLVADNVGPVAAERAVAMPGYTIVDLGALPGSSGGVARAINAFGQVVGYSGGAHAFLWQTATGMQDLGTLPGGAGSRALDINDQAQVVGSSYTAVGKLHAFLWQPSTGMQDLGTLPGDEYTATHDISFSEALGINNQGQVVGDSSAGRNIHAFVWQASTGMHDLGTLGGPNSYALDINDLGLVVGWSSTATGKLHAFLWQPNTGMRDLGSLPGEAASYAEGVNDQAQVVGYADQPAPEAFLWQSANGLLALGALPGYCCSEAYAVNRQGQVVGRSIQSTEHETFVPYHAFLWQAGTGMQDLGTLPGGAASYAYDINDKGQVVGSSTTYDGQQSPVLWQPLASTTVTPTPTNVPTLTPTPAPTKTPVPPTNTPVLPCAGAPAGYPNLGGASAFTVFALNTTGKQTVNFSNDSVTGDVAVVAGATVTNQAPSTVNGNVFVSSGASFGGPGHVTGSVLTGQALSAARTAAINASAHAAALSPNSTFGDITSNTTVKGESGLNVVQVNGNIRLSNASLTLSGPADAFFVVNLSGSMTLGGSGGIKVGGSVPTSHLLINMTGSGKLINTHVRNSVQGTILGPNVGGSLNGAFGSLLLGQNFSQMGGVLVSFEGCK